MNRNRSIPIFPGARLIGHTLEFRNHRIEWFLRLARAHPQIARARISVLDAVIVSAPELVHEILVDKPESFKKSLGMSVFAAPILGDGLLRLEQQAHRKRRRMVAPPFMPRRILGYAGVMIARAESAAQRMLSRGEVDIAEETTRVTMEIVAKTLFDAEVAGDADNVGMALSEAMTCMFASLTSLLPMPPKIPTPTNLRLHRAVRRLDEVVYRMIRERRAQPDQDRGDLLSILLATRDQDDNSALSDKDVRDEAMTLFLAGHETTANTLAWALYLLAINPAARARLEDELDEVVGNGPLTAEALPRLRWTLQVVKESMRLLPPVYMVSRQAATDVEIGGHKLARGTLILLNIIGMHRRPDLYPEPERFDPERFSPEREKLLPPQAFMPFGAGPRICIGSHFALMEAQLILASWVLRLRFEPRDTTPPKFEPLITLRPLGGIAMKVSARPRPLAEAQPSLSVQQP